MLAVALWMLAPSLAQPVGAGPVCEAAEYGMTPGESDSSAAFARTLEACAGRTIHIAHGTYVFQPRGFAVGFTIPAGTTLVGDRSKAEVATVLQVASSGTFQALLWVRNVSHVSIRDIRFEGSPYDSGCSRGLDYGHAIYVHSDKGASEAVNDVVISDDVFRNFNGESWVTLNAADGSPGIGVNGSIAVRGNVFDSDQHLAGGCAARNGIIYAVHMVALHGSDASPNGLVANTAIESNTFNAGYVRGAVAIWSGTRAVDIAHNTILDAGRRLPMYPAAELGRYAILIYNSAHEHPGLHPDTIRVIDNTVTNPVSCGIYVALGRNLEIRGNRISGQTDRYDGTLPKGAISLNHAESVLSLEDNVLTNNYIGISSVGSKITMGTNRISVPPGGRSELIVH